MIKGQNGAAMPESNTDARLLVNNINEFYANTGVCNSQRAKYEKPNWAFVAACLPGSDKEPVSCVQISAMLKKHQLLLTPTAIYRIIRHMVYRREAIHPHRRNIGQSCALVVRDMGEIKFSQTTDKDGVVENFYWFDRRHSEIIKLRRALELIIKP